MGNAGITSNGLASAISHLRSSGTAPLCMLSLGDAGRGDLHTLAVRWQTAHQSEGG